MKKRGRRLGTIKEPIAEVVEWYMAGLSMNALAAQRGVSRQYYDLLVRRYIADGRMLKNAREVHRKKAIKMGYHSDARRSV